VRASDPAGLLASANYPSFVAVTAGATTGEINFPLAAAGSSSGVVTYRVGTTPTAVVNVEVMATDYTTNEWLGNSYTNATGAYSIRGLPQGGQYRVRVNPRNTSGPPYFDFPNFVSEFYNDHTAYGDADPVPPGGLSGDLAGINFEIALGGSISGVVTDAQNNPLQNVWLWAEDFGSGQYFDGDHTDHNGFYIIRGLPGGASYRVGANAYPLPFLDQYWQNTPDRNQATPVAVTANTTSEQIDFALAPGHLIGGTVKTGDGTAIPNVRVDVRTLDGRTVTSGTSDSAGHYQVRVAAGQYRLVPYTGNTDYAPTTVDVSVVDVDQPSVDLTLPPGAAISGHVYEDASSTIPVPNVLIQVFDFATNQSMGSATTSSDGSYRVRGLASGSYKVQLEPDVRNFVRMYYPDTPFTASPLPVTAPAGAENINFHVLVGNEIHGFVFYDKNANGRYDLDDGDVPLSNINVNANPVSGSYSAGTGTGSNGHFVMHGVYPGDYRVQARAQGTPYASEFHLMVGADPVGTFKRDLAGIVHVNAAGEAATTGIDFSLVLGGGIRGVVRNQSSTPIANINVSVNPGNWQGMGFGAWTDSQGSYLINGLAAGADLPYTVSTSDPSGTYVGQYFNGRLFSSDADGVTIEQRTTTDDPRAAQVDFILSIGGFVEGIVFTDTNGNGSVDTGEQLAGSNVQVSEFASPNRTIRSGTSGADGSFRIGGLPPNLDLRVQANSPANQDYLRVFYKFPIGTADQTQAQAISLTPGATLSGVLLGLVSGGAITGTVRDGNGQPIPSLTVCSEAIPPAQFGGCGSTDALGVYILHALSPGTHRVRAGGSPTLFAQEYYDNRPQQTLATSVTVTAQGITPGIDFRLVQVPTGVSALSVSSGARGATIPGATVTAQGLTASACASTPVAPCSRIEIGGGGVTVTNLTLTVSTFTFDLVIAPNAPLGTRTFSVVNHFSLEDGAAVITNGFEVTGAGGAPSSGSLLYVSDGASGQIRAYSTVDNSLVRTIDANGQPNALALSPDQALLYAAGVADRSVSVMDTRLGAEVGRIGVDGNSGINAIAATSRRIYVVNTQLLDRVTVLDATTWAPAGEIVIGANTYPSALRLDPTGLWLYAANRSTNPAQQNGTVSVIDTTSDAVVATISFPPNVSPRGIAFRPDGQRAYVVAATGTYVIDTATRTFVSPTPLPTTGGGNGAIDVAPYPSDPAHSFAYIVSGGRLWVFDVTADPPAFVRSIQLGRTPISVRAMPDGSRVYIAHSGSKDLYVLDTPNLMTSPAVSMTRFATVVQPSGGMAVGPLPAAAPASAPVISGVSVAGGSPAHNGARITVTVTGSNFDSQPIVWLKGSLTRGTVVSASSGSVTFDLPPTTPTGDYRIVVSNPKTGGNDSGISTTSLAVRPPLSFEASQTVYVSDAAHARVTVLRPNGETTNILTEPFPAGLAIAPDGRSGFVLHSYVGPQPLGTSVADLYQDGVILDLDPTSPTYRTAVATIPMEGNVSLSNPAVPSFQDPRGVFFYAPNGTWLDSLSVVDPVNRREVDIDTRAGTASILPGDPMMGMFEPRLHGINRIPMDAYEPDGNTYPYAAAITPDGSLLYVANIGYAGDPEIPAVPAGVLIVDPFAYQKIGHLTQADNGPLHAPQAVAIAPRGLATDMAPYGAGTVFVHVTGYDSAGTPALFIFRAGETTPASAFVDRIALPEFPTGLAVSDDGLTTYLALRTSSRLACVDVTPRVDGSGRVNGAITYVSLAAGVTRLAVAYQDMLLYVGNLYRSEVQVFDIGATPTAPVLLTTLGAPTPTNIAVQPVFNRPRIGSISPPWGAQSGGTAVTINGANFAPSATVEFRGAGGTYVAATNVIVADASTITALTPPGTGLADVRVTNPGAEPVADVLAGRFEYRSDTTPPVFTTPPYVASQTLHGSTVTVEIRWTTDEASTSRVDYGTGGTLSLQVSNPTLVTEHVITLTGLTPNVAYVFRASSTDSQGNTSSSPSASTTTGFTTLVLPDTTPPEITSGPSAAKTTVSATIVWTTNEESTSVVRFDQTIDGTVHDTASSVTGAGGLSHSVVINGLSPDTLYEYRVVSADASGNARTSAVATFRTNALPDTTPPAITLGPTVSYLSNDLVIVTWTTDELSTSFINYGVSSIDEQSIVDSDKVTTHVMFLTNLLPGTSYRFQVGSTDASGNTCVTANPFAPMSAQALGVSRLTANQTLGGARLMAGTMLAVSAAAAGFDTPAKPDTTPPSVTEAAVITVIAFDKVLVTVGTNEVASILARFTVGGTSGSAFDPSFTLSHSLLLTGLAGNTRYDLVLVLTDPKGNTRTVSGLTFTTPAAPDTLAPVVSGLAAAATSATTATISWTTDEPADAVVHYGIGGALDNALVQAALTTSHMITLTGLQPGASYTVSVTSADGSGNRSASSRTTFTTPYVAPVVTGVMPDRISQGSQNVRVVISGAHFEPRASANVGPGMSLGDQTVDSTGTHMTLAVSVAPDASLGSRTITITNPSSGLTASATLTIVDASAPTITVTTPSEGATVPGATITVAGTVSEMATVTVNGAPATVTGTGPYAFHATVRLPAGGGNHIVVLAVDASGNRSSAVVNVTVNDAEPPQLTLTASPAVLWPPNHKLVPVTITVTATDNVDQAPLIQLVSVTSSEPDSGTENGDEPGDIQGAALGTDDRSVLLRAERYGNGPGRTYTLTYRATDRAGNVTERQVTVVVPHDQK
jgi:hypothetical protein